jgi:hypothetical protein
VKLILEKAIETQRAQPKVGASKREHGVKSESYKSEHVFLIHPKGESFFVLSL